VTQSKSACANVPLYLLRVFENRLDEYLETDIYGKVISKSVKNRATKRARPDDFLIPEMSRFAKFKKIMDAFYAKSSAYKVRNLQIRPNTFENRITSFVAAPEFIATGERQTIFIYFS